MSQNNIAGPDDIHVSWGYRTILIVEDVEPNFKFLEAALVHTGATIEHARSGHEAIEKCKANKQIDLVLMDLHMPEMSGLHLLKAIRMGTGGIQNDLPFIMMTGYNKVSLVTVAIVLDVDAFIVKSSRKDKISERLEQVS